MSAHTIWELMLRGLAAVLMLSSFSAPATAQDAQAGETACDVTVTPSRWQAHPRGPDGLLQQLMGPACLGDPTADKADRLVKQFNEVTPNWAQAADADVMQRVAAGRAALTVLRTHAVARSGSEWRSMAAHLQSVDEAVQRGLGNSDVADYRLRLAQAMPRDPFALGLDAATEGAVRLGGETYKLLAPTHCTKDAATCAVLTERVELIRTVNLLGRLSRYLQADALLAAQADLVLRNAQWTAYREGGRHQYFWEVWLNGRLMDCPQNEKGIPVGFCPVPTQQWLLLHPEAALVFNHKAGQSSDLQPSLTVELLGYHRWEWAGNNAQMRKRFGVSLLAAYSKHDGRNHWSFGPKFVFGAGYHLGVTRAPGGRWSVAVNLPLSDELFGRKQEYTDYLKMLRKPDMSKLW